jgi:hypothetical protein
MPNFLFDKFKGSDRPPSFFNPRTGFFRAKAGTGFIQGAKIGYSTGLKGNLPFAILGGAYAAATAPKGQAVSRGLASGVGWGGTAAIAGILGTMVGGPAAGWVASVVAPMVLGDSVDKAIVGMVQPLVDFGSNMRKMRFGGDYRDTQTAYTMRAVAAREMSTSLMNARQWLGQEGAFMHQ